MLSSCIHLPKNFHSLTFSNSRVKIDSQHYYKVGPLEKGWRLLSSVTPGLEWYHSEWRASLATSALCGSQFEDLPLATLTNQVIGGLPDLKITQQKVLTLNGREALHTVASARVDGVAVALQVVVLKKNNCQFDFMMIAPQAASAVSEAFKQFYSGFDY